MIVTVLSYNYIENRTISKENKSSITIFSEGAPVEVPIDPTEYRFKLALINRRYDEVTKFQLNFECTKNEHE